MHGLTVKYKTLFVQTSYCRYERFILIEIDPSFYYTQITNDVMSGRRNFNYLSQTLMIHVSVLIFA